MGIFWNEDGDIYQNGYYVLLKLVNIMIQLGIYALAFEISIALLILTG